MEEVATLVVEYSDGLELVGALRPILAEHGYVVTSATSAAHEGVDHTTNVKLQFALEALDRLFEIAGRDTHQSRHVADFLLAWWNARRDGGFDLTSLWNLDDKICEDLATVFHLIASSRSYPDSYGYDDAIRSLVKQWRRHNTNE